MRHGVAKPARTAGQLCWAVPCRLWAVVYFAYLRICVFAYLRILRARVCACVCLEEEDRVVILSARTYMHAMPIGRVW